MACEFHLALSVPVFNFPNMDVIEVMSSNRPKIDLPYKDMGRFAVFSISNSILLDATLEIRSYLCESSKPGGKISLSSSSKRTGVFASTV